jgi:16S rRNA (guanine527-N7)-methyltransferase
VSEDPPPAHTGGPPPPAASVVFGDRLPSAVRYADLLCTDGVLRGVIGPREAARIWPRHLLNGAALAQLVPEGARVIDLGSGAGLPGIPLALARPDLDVTLLEPLARRVAFLEETVAALDLAVRIVCDRAEDAAGTGADVVVARAVAPFARLVPLAVPLLRSGGLLLAVKGASARAELEAATGALRLAGVAGTTVVQVEVAGSEPLTVIRCVAGPEPIPSGRARNKRAR